MLTDSVITYILLCYFSQCIMYHTLVITYDNHVIITLELCELMNIKCYLPLCKLFCGPGVWIYSVKIRFIAPFQQFLFYVLI